MRAHCPRLRGTVRSTDPLERCRDDPDLPTTRDRAGGDDDRLAGVTQELLLLTRRAALRRP